MPSELIQHRLGKNAIATDAAAKPCGEWLLIGKAGRVHRPEFRREQLGVTTAHPEHDQRSRIPYHRGSHGVRELVRVLVRETKMEREFSRLGQQGCEGVRAERLEFVDMGEKRDAVFGGKGAALLRDQLQMRDEERPRRFAACSPIVPLARLAMRMRRLFIVNERSRRGAICPRMSRRCGEAAICPTLLRTGAIASERSDLE